MEYACIPGQRDIERRTLEDQALAAFITQLVALATGVGAREIAAGSRCSGGVFQSARQVAMYLAHTVCAWPLARVGSAFGRDRSTAAHACQRVEDMREDKAFDSLGGPVRSLRAEGAAPPEPVMNASASYDYGLGRHSRGADRSAR